MYGEASWKAYPSVAISDKINGCVNLMILCANVYACEGFVKKRRLMAIKSLG